MAVPFKKIILAVIAGAALLTLVASSWLPSLAVLAFWLFLVATLAQLTQRSLPLKLPAVRIKPSEWYVVIAGFLAFALLASIPLVGQPGVIGGRHDWALPGESLRGFLDSGSSAWHLVNLGEVAFFFPTYLLDLVFGLLGVAGMSGEFFSKLFLVAAITGSGVSFFSFARRLGGSPAVAGLAGLFYATTPILYDKIIAGHLGYLMSYAVAPAYLAELVALEKKPTRQGLGRAVMSFVLASVQIQFTVMLLGFTAIFALVGPNRRQVFRLIGFSLFGLVGFHAPWLLANFGTITSQASQLARDAAVLDWIASLSSPLETTFRLASQVLPYFLAQTSRLTWWQPLAGALVGGLLISPWLIRHRLASYFALTALVGLFLAKGTSAPFTSFYQEIFLKLPATAMFREVNHWLFIPAISYAVLLTLLASAARERLGRLWPAAFVVGIIVTIGFGIPFWQGKLGADLQTLSYPGQDRELAAFLRKQTGRILFLPAHQKNRYPGKPFSGIDPFIQEFADRTFEQEGNVLAETSPAHRLRNLILAGIYGSDPTHLTALLARADIRWVVLRNHITDEFPLYTLAKDFPNREVSFDQAQAERNLKSGGLILERNFGTTQLYRLAEPSSKFYLSQAPLPSEPEPILAVQPADFANRFFDPTKGFVKAHYLWWYHSQFVTIEDRAVHAQTPAALDLPFPVRQPGILYVRALVDPKGGDVRIKLDQSEIATLDLTGSPSRWQWFELGLVSHGNEISLEHINGEVTVGKVALFPSKIDTRVPAVTLGELLLRDHQVVSYQPRGTTAYRLTVTTDRPRLLVFAESYAPGWSATVNGRPAEHTRVGFANGFLIDSAGSHDVEISFEPERLYRFGLFLAFVTLATLVVLSIKRQY